MSNTATTETVTQYGIRQPNGEIIWATKNVSGYLGLNIEQTAKGERTFDEHTRSYTTDGRAAMACALRKVASDVGTPAEEYVHGHEYVSREVITVTMAPVVVPAPAVEARF